MTSGITHFPSFPHSPLNSIVVDLSPAGKMAENLVHIVIDTSSCSFLIALFLKIFKELELMLHLILSEVEFSRTKQAIQLLVMCYSDRFTICSLSPSTSMLE